VSGTNQAGRGEAGTAKPVTMTEAEWAAEGSRRFGPDKMKWRFECPLCGNVATPEDFRPFKDQGATPSSVTNECIGRYVAGAAKAFGEAGSVKGKGPCDYAGYGLLRFSPVRIAGEAGTAPVHCFGFAEPADKPVPNGEVLTGGNPAADAKLATDLGHPTPYQAPRHSRSAEAARRSSVGGEQ